jgi:hypothetical protein
MLQQVMSLLESGSIPGFQSKSDGLGYQGDGDGSPEVVEGVGDCGFNVCVAPLYESCPLIASGVGL